MAKRPSSVDDLELLAQLQGVHPRVLMSLRQNRINRELAEEADTRRQQFLAERQARAEAEATEQQNRIRQFQLRLLQNQGQPRINTGPVQVGEPAGLPPDIFQDEAGTFRNRPRFKPTGTAVAPEMITTGPLPQAQMVAQAPTPAPTGPATTEQFTPPLERFGAQLGGFVEGVANPLETMKGAISGFIPEEVKRGFRQVRKGIAGPQPQIDTTPSGPSPFFGAGVSGQAPTPQEQRIDTSLGGNIGNILQQIQSDPFLMFDPAAKAQALGHALDFIASNLDRQQKYDTASLDFVARQLATEASRDNSLLDALSQLATSGVVAGQTQEGLFRGAPITRNPLMQGILQRTMELLNQGRQTGSEDPLGIR